MASHYWDKNFLQHINVDTTQIIFEVGARYGNESIALRNLFPNATIYSFEPNPLTKDRCSETLKPEKNINFFPFALGEKEEQLPFYSFVGGNDGASSLYKRIDFDQTQKQTGVAQVDTLERFVRNNKVSFINYLCMDTQGFELNILKGAKHFISKIQYIVMEEPNPVIDLRFLPKGVHSKHVDSPNAQEIKEFMTASGFIEIERNIENHIEHNVMYKNLNFNS
jgi:FkbM family methyltransferase